MLKFIPLLTAAILALPVPLLAQDTGSVLRIIEAQDQIVRIQGQDEAHHCNRVARSPRTFLISWWGIPSIGT